MPKEHATLPAQEQLRQPGIEAQMHPLPESLGRKYRGCDKLLNKIALITGGDSGIGRAAAIAFAKEGAHVAFVYLDEREDADRTRREIELTGRRCLAIAANLADETQCRLSVERVAEEFGVIDILVNNAAEQHSQMRLEDISAEQLRRTFETNVFSMFYCTQAALPHMRRGGRIINTASVTAYRGSDHLIDYASTKGAIVAFTRSLALSLAEREIHVNAVAPGPVWTPLIPASLTAEEVRRFGSQVPLGRPAQPDEIAPSFVFLASEGANYMTGQVLHPNGGEIINA